ncbi:MAG: PIN domain nuclease [Acidobacteriota bacterium]
MTLVDSSVWIDCFRGVVTPQTNTLDRLLGSEDLVIGDLILAQVLQGFAEERDFRRAEKLLGSLTVVELCGHGIAVQAAKNFRRLRRMDVTIRSTIHCVIATWCIENNCALLHSDRDFDAFEKHLSLRVR